MRTLFLLGALLLAAAPLWPRPADSGDAPLPSPDDTGHSSEHTFEHTGPRHPDAELVCATGCNAAPEPDDGHLTLARYRELLATWSSVDDAARAAARDELFFHGERVLELAKTHGTFELTPEERDALLVEAGRLHARLSVRFTNAADETRLLLDDVRVPLGEKQHLFPEFTRDLEPPEVSGTVRRVGAEHLWVRL